MEADAADAAARVGDLAVRGPLFGVAVQHAGDGQRWQVVVPVMEGCPQRARDNLNSLLWFRARDDAQDRAERRALLAAVARLETERVDDLVVGGVPLPDRARRGVRVHGPRRHGAAPAHRSGTAPPRLVPRRP
ncbi:DUF5954 family protein [Streptomyces clavuligerus]|uniref:DUF5954 family protein n=1 Tax=Streptomyces clavuligerus TaxID=1901 RepID=UPI001F071E2B|nr:DUF5954 family protein [Streptomyces clavuligerus]